MFKNITVKSTRKDILHILSIDDDRLREEIVHLKANAAKRKLRWPRRIDDIQPHLKKSVLSAFGKEDRRGSVARCAFGTTLTKLDFDIRHSDNDKCAYAYASRSYDLVI